MCNCGAGRSSGFFRSILCFFSTAPEPRINSPVAMETNESVTHRPEGQCAYCKSVRWFVGRSVISCNDNCILSLNAI